MRTKNLLYLAPICGLMLAMSLTTARAQSANWIGPATGGEWNTAADWDAGVVPGVATNALIAATTNVSYNNVMSASTFGTLTLNGVLNINNSGFVCTGISLIQPGGGPKLFVNSGGAVNTTSGTLALSSNAMVTVASGGSLNVGELELGTANNANAIGIVTNNGGTFTATSTVINNNNASATSLFVIQGGTCNLGAVTINRAGPSSQPALGSEGLVIYNGVVNMTSLHAGSSAANSFLSCYVAGGIVTNSGPAFIHLSATANRPARFIQTGGLFVDPDPNIVTLSPTNGATAVTVYTVQGGTNIVGGFQFGDLTPDTGIVNFTNAANLYIGSQGIVTNGAVTINAWLNNGGLLGATAPWESFSKLQLGAGTFTFQAADPSGNANNITLSNIVAGSGTLNKTGGGTLILEAANTYGGSTIINSSTLAIGPAGSVSSSFIYLYGGTIFDVSQVSGGYNMIGSQTISGSGTVNGALNLASGSTLYPGSNVVTGTLTVNGAITETGGGVMEFQLSSSPTGPNNDLLMAPGGLNVSGANTITVNGALQSGGIYPLINYSGGTFSGSTANFTVGGDSGTLSNSVANSIIYFIAQASVRGSTNTTWVGNATNLNWDTETSTNWIIDSSSGLTTFVPGDNVLFSGLGQANSPVTISTTVSPGSVTNTANYTFTGNGAIGGTGGITVNSGTSTVLTTNSYTGATVLNGGVLSTPVIANSGVNSGIGAASAAPGNVVFNGGTLAYTGGSASTDHGITLTNGGGTIDVANGDVLALNGNIGGNGTLTVVDSGTLILNNGNSYTNTTTIANGSSVELGSASGAGSGTINFSNGIVIYPSPAVSVENVFNFSLNSTNMIIVTNGGSVNPISDGNWTGGGVILVSNTYNPYTLNGVLDGVTGTIELVTPNGAALRFNSSGGNTCLGSTNAIFNLGIGTGQITDRNGGAMNLGALTGGPNTSLTGQDADSGTTTWTIGWNNLSTSFYGTIENSAANRLSALTKVGSGTLFLGGGLITNIVTIGFNSATNIGVNLLSYTGNTTVSNGTLAVTIPDLLTNSLTVTLAAPNAVLNASAMGYVSNEYDQNDNLTNSFLVTNSIFEVISGQTLAGIGTLNGLLLQDSGSTFNVGLPTGVFTVTSNANLSGNITMDLDSTDSPANSELVAQSFTVNSANLTVNNIGPGLVNGATFQLFNQAVSGLSVTLPATDPTDTTNYNWTDNISVNGSITLTSGGLPGPPPTISASVNGHTLTLSWPVADLGYFLQIQTNSLSKGLSTNWVNVPNSQSVTSTNFTLVPTNPCVFFRLMQ